MNKLYLLSAIVVLHVWGAQHPYHQRVSPARVPVTSGTSAHTNYASSGYYQNLPADAIYYSMPYMMPAVHAPVPYFDPVDPAYVLPTLPPVTSTDPYQLTIKGSPVNLRWLLTLENYRKLSLFDLFKADGMLALYYGVKNDKPCCGYIASMRPGLTDISFYFLIQSAPDRAGLWPVTDAHQAYRIGTEMNRIIHAYPSIFNSNRLDEIRRMYLSFSNKDMSTFIPSLDLVEQGAAALYAQTPSASSAQQTASLTTEGQSATIIAPAVDLSKPETATPNPHDNESKSNSNTDTSATLSTTVAPTLLEESATLATSADARALEKILNLFRKQCTCSISS